VRKGQHKPGFFEQYSKPGAAVVGLVIGTILAVGGCSLLFVLAKSVVKALAN
jgi:hypothetical protein